MFSRNPAAGATELPFSGDKIKRADFWRTKVPVCICRFTACLLVALASQFTINSTLFAALHAKWRTTMAGAGGGALLAKADAIVMIFLQSWNKDKLGIFCWNFYSRSIEAFHGDESRGNYSYNRFLSLFVFKFRASCREMKKMYSIDSLHILSINLFFHSMFDRRNQLRLCHR